MTMLVRGGAGAGSSLPTNATPGQVLQWNGAAWVPATPSASGTTPNATTTAPGLVQLAGDLAGTAAAPTVAKINGAAPAPVATSGKYADLTGAPTLAPVATSGAYGDLTGRPLLAPVATSGAYGDLTGAPPAVQTAYKASSTTITSSTTKAADPHLAFASVPVGSYALEIEGTQYCANASVGVAWSVTGSATFTTSNYGTVLATTSGAGALAYTIVTTTGSTIANSGGASFPFRIALTVAVTAPGSLAFSWAQGVSNAGGVSVQTGSWARLTKVA